MISIYYTRLPPVTLYHSLTQLQVQREATEKAKTILQSPHILPERELRGEIIEVDEDIAGAISNKMIFTETTQHKDNEVKGEGEYLA